MALRRLFLSFALGTLLVGWAALAVPHAHHYPPRCPGAGELSLVLPGACAHDDVAPPGVDPHQPVPTALLRQRDGAGVQAYEAAEQLGVAAPQSVNVATPAVPCDGDGTSGYRVQAMYVVEAGSTNRYAALQASFRLWAAGVDDVINRSAALTGGVRHVRYVTEPSGGGCVAKVLNVTVPNGSLSSFGATISAVQALGYTDPARKYLMWTDATALCGVATLYPGDGESQANPNNGFYPQYARIDSGCWGFGDGARDHSVEAHELLHTLGGVQDSAPHSTHAGHCWDESDTMCYADGGNHAMVQVCPSEREYFYDCSNDDYFSTYPDPGSYLDGHWNAADSRFLIGGGDGTGGGSAGTPTVLGATIAVNNPAVPGLATQASVAPSLPAGRTLASVTWKSTRADCTFSAPTELQTEVTCNATSAAAATVTATLVDSTGATKAVASPLTFATGTARPVTVALSAAGQTPANGGSAAVCSGAPFALAATVVDDASGQPVKGLAATFTKKTEAMTSAVAAGTATTTAEGTASTSQTATVSTTYKAQTSAGTVYAAGGPAALVAVPAKCATSLTAAADPASVYYGDPVTVSGRLTATSAGTPVAAAGVSLAVRLTTGDGKVLSLGTVKTGADGSYSLAVKPTASGTVSVALTASTSYAAATATAGSLTVRLPETALTGAVSPTDVGYGTSVEVTGTLQRVAGGSTTPLAGKTVGILVAPAGGGATVKIGSATTTATGAFTTLVPLRVSGTLSVSFTAVAGQPGATVEVGPVKAGTWTTAVTASASAATVPSGGTVTLSGTVTKAYGAAPVPAGAVKVSIYFKADGASTRTLVASPTTAANGTFSQRVTPKATGTWTAVVGEVAGYTGSSATPLTVHVG
ncbi:hypothetical protein [Nocardioides panacisoli]|uniref:Big-1 domain-containing protein n=1 Tax=Nocardioides panacisoli TaxID=627624 RepID=A0ABP7IYC4_9ACTN